MTTQKYGYHNGKQIDPGEGWAIVPEKEPQTKDMEYYQSNRWHKNYSAFGQPAIVEGVNFPVLAYRRRIQSKPKWGPPNLAKGWRCLEVGEVICTTDKCHHKKAKSFDDSDKWRFTECSDCHRVESGDSHWYFRRITEQDGSEAPKTSTLPTVEVVDGWQKVGAERDGTRAIWVCYKNCAGVGFVTGYAANAALLDPSVAFWQYATIPTPPIPEKSKGELAWEAVKAKSGGSLEVMGAFLAGFEAGSKEGK